MKIIIKVILTALVTFVSTSAFAEKAKPNVILILVDDLKPAIAAYGDETSVTPNIDRLTDMGMRFDLAYCNQAVCMASRYNLMLGSRSTSTGFYSFGTEFREIYPDAITLPQHFMNNGYHAESMGKVFHIGHGNTNDDASWSIPHFKEKVIEYVVPESTNRELTREEAFFQNTRKHFKDLPPNKELPRGAAWEYPDVLDDAYADGRVAFHAINRLRVLNKSPEQPFFMAIGFARPHLPFSAPKKYWDFYDADELPMPEYVDAPEGTPMWIVKRGGEITQFKPLPEQGPFSDEHTRMLIHGYYASTSYVDAQIGRVIDELERLEMLDNTIIALWGDHGWHLGDHGSWTKHSNHEQAVRIPISIYAPGVTTPKSSSLHLVETVDLYPTLSDLAGLPEPETVQPIDGLSLVPVLKDSEVRVRDHAYHAYAKMRGKKMGCAIRTEQYRMVAWFDTEDPEEEVFYELYDYVNDPLETKNFAKEKPEIVQELMDILETHPKFKNQVKRS